MPRITKSFIKPEELAEFREKFRSERRNAEKQYIAMRGYHDKLQLKNLLHYDFLAAYMHALHYDEPIVLAAMAHGLRGEYLEKFAGTTQQPGEVLAITRRYQDLLNDPDIDINVQMATAVGGYDSLRASALRAADFLHSIEEKLKRKDGAQFLSLARDLYLPLFNDVLVNRRLANDLGREIIRLQDPRAYNNLANILGGHAIVASKSMEPFISRLKTSLKDPLLMQHPLRYGARKDYTIEERAKSVYSTHAKLAEKGYTLETIPDLHGIRLIIKRIQGETDAQVARRLREVKRIALNQLVKEQNETRGKKDGVIVQKSNVEDYYDPAVRRRLGKRNEFKAINIPFHYKGGHIEIQIVDDKQHEENEWGGASRIGYKHPHLSPETVMQLDRMREAHAKGMPLEALSKMFKNEA